MDTLTTMKKFYITLEVNLLQSSSTELSDGASFRYTTEKSGETIDAILGTALSEESASLKTKYGALFAGITVSRIFYLNEHNAAVDIV